MVLLSRKLLFGILSSKQFWDSELNSNTLKQFQAIVENHCALAFDLDEKSLEKLRAELFRLKAKGKRARSKGGNQFQRFLVSLENSNYTWDVPISRHKSELLVELKMAEKDAECSAMLEKCKLEYENLLKAEKQKIESTFYEYIIKTESSEKQNLKRKPFQDCTPSYQSKRRKSESEMCKRALNFLDDLDMKPVSVIVSRQGREEVIQLYESEERENSGLDDLNTLVYVLDCFNVSNEAYHELSMLFKTMPRSTTLQQYICKINQNYKIVNTPDGLGVQQSFKQHLQDVVSYLLVKDANFASDGKLVTKISGDGTQIGKRIHVVNVTFTIINENRSGSAQGNYPLCIVRTKEKYSNLSLALQDLRQEVSELQGSLLEIGGRTFSVEIMLGGDYKFLLVAVGIPSIACQHVCIYCKCSKSERFDLCKSWSLSDENLGARLVYAYEDKNVKRGTKSKKDEYYSVKNPPLFSSIGPSQIVIDQLHMFLRICDKLFGLLIAELRLLDNITSHTTFSELDRNKLKHVSSLEHVLQMLGIDFVLGINSETRKLEYRELTGPEKLKFLSSFNASDFFSDETRAHCVQKVWNNFRELNEIIKGDAPNPDNIETLAKDWCKLYVDTYQARDITPYMHVLRFHVGELVRLHGNIIKYSQQGLEKLNDIVTKQYFRSSSHKGQIALKQVMEKQNRMTFLEDFKRKKNEKLCSICRQNGHTKVTCQN